MKIWHKKCFLSVFILLIGLGVSAKAEMGSIEDIAERLRESDMDRKSIFLQISEKEKNPEMLYSSDELKNQAAGRDGFLLREYLNNHREGYLYQNYAGAYINSSNEFVILLSGDLTKAQEEIKQIGFETKVLLKAGRGSFYETESNLSEINERIAEINQKALKEQCTEEEKRLMAFYPSAQYEDCDNSILVRLVAKDKELAEAIRLFEALAGRYSEVRYESCSIDDVTMNNCATTVYPGGGIRIYDYAYYNNIASAGYRAYYTDGASNYYGIVTAGHAAYQDRNAYWYPTNSSSATHIGNVKYRQYGTIDAAFIQLNSNATVSPYVYYANAAGTNPSSVLLTSSCEVPYYGQTLYKSGRTTYLTSKTVSSTSAAAYVDGVYFYNMIAVPEAIGASGDSGGVAYTLVSSTQGKPAGILQAVKNADDVTYFQKATLINSFFGISAY